MKYIFWCLFCLGPIGLASAENPPNNNIVSGKIVDSSSHPLAGATVTIPDLQAGTNTDQNGNYSLKNLPDGSYLIEVQYIGYQTITRTIRIQGSMTINFTLSPAVLEQGEIVVTGLSMATEARKSPTPISVINHQYLAESVSSNIIDAIARQPGVNAVTTGPAISKPVIRGLSYNRVVVVNDGIRQEGQQWGDEHGIEIDDYNVNRIEILKGPASLMYGSDGLAGVVNIISNDPVPSGTVGGNINTNYQTNNGQMAYNANIAGNLNGLYWNAYGTEKLAHDYRNGYDGYVFNSKFQNTDFGGFLGINRGWGHTRVEFASFDQHLGIPEGNRDSSGAFTKDEVINGNDSLVRATRGDFLSYQPLISRQHIRHQKVVLDNDFYLSNTGRINLTLGYQQSRRQEFSDILIPESPGLDLRLRTFDYDAKYYLPVSNGWESIVGLGGMAQNNANLGREFLIPAYNLFDFGAFFLAKKSWDRVTFTGGLRGDNRYLDANNLFLDSTGVPVQKNAAGAIRKFTSFTRDFFNLSGSAGLSYSFSDRFIGKANISRGFRAPNASELGANGVHDGTIRYEYGSHNLKSEVSTEGDAGIGYTSTHITLSADLFYNHISNFIFTRKLLSYSGADSIPAVDNSQGYLAYQYIQTNAHLYGTELSIDLHPHPLDWLHFKNTFSYVRGVAEHATDSTKYLPWMPPGRWISELRGEFLKNGKTFRNLYLQVGMDLNLAQNEAYTAYGTETTTPGYTLWNLEAGTDLMSGHRRIFSIYLGGDNITNLSYQNHLSRFKYLPINPATGRMGIFNMGSNYSIKLNIPLDFNVTKREKKTLPDVIPFLSSPGPG